MAPTVGYMPSPPPADMPSMPLAVPPPGLTPDFEHPASNSFHVTIAVAICIPIIVILASLRMYNLLCIHRQRTVADYTFMLATVWTIIYFGLVMALLNKGLFGIHIWELRLQDLTNTPFLLVLLLESLYGPFVWLIKTSLFLLYRQIFSTKRYLQNLVWAGVIVTGLFYWSTTIAKIALCAPRGHETYIMAFATARCGRTKSLAVGSGVFNVLSDLYLIVIPIPPTWSLHMKPRKKWRLIAVFLTGILAFNASALGLHFRVDVNRSLDDTWKIMPFYLSIIVEMTAGITVLCMPSIAAIVRHHKPAVMAYFNRNSAYRNQNSNQNSSHDNENQQGTFYQMSKLRKEITTSNSQTVESQGNTRHGHMAKSSDDSAIQLRSHTPDSETLTEGPSAAAASPKI
ncbi:MAG: hypothetical protein Q9186_005926 [Xanthomendoza sp. 1 TL-2023]